MHEIAGAYGPWMSGIGSDPSKLDGRKTTAAEAAKEFEALLISQMLRTARESATADEESGGAMGSNSAVMEYAEQQIARAMTSGGGLGLSSMIEKSLSQQQAARPAQPKQ